MRNWELGIRNFRLPHKNNRDPIVVQASRLHDSTAADDVRAGRPHHKDRHTRLLGLGRESLISGYPLSSSRTNQQSAPHLSSRAEASRSDAEAEGSMECIRSALTDFPTGLS